MKKIFKYCLNTTLHYANKHHNALNIILLILTLFAVLWYSCETRQMRIIAQKQIEFAAMPRLVVAENDCSQYFIMVNEGYGAALNLRIDNFKNKKGGDFKVDLQNFPNRLLSNMGSNPIYIKINGVDMPEFAQSDSFGISYSKIHYESMYGDKYYIEIFINVKNDINIVSFGKIHKE